jgi:hypothetical protein
MKREMSQGCLEASSKSNYSSLQSSMVLNAVFLNDLQIYHLGRSYHNHPCRQLHAEMTIADLTLAF